MSRDYPHFIANRPAQPQAWIEVHDKAAGTMIARAGLATADEIDRAIAAAVDATRPMRQLKPFQRQQILQHCVDRFQQRSDELAELLCAEAGKPIRDARGEVQRLVDTFRIAAEEATRIGGEVINLEISSRAAGYRGMYRRVPLGPCSFITPFNFPLNLVAHKVAPAIAAGCPFVLKPASLTPLGALVIAEILAETDLPAGAFSVLPCRRDQADAFTTDDRLKLLSFTGSAQVGWDLKARAGRKKVVLELGGNAACIVDRDVKDLDTIVERLIVGAFYQSGQSCISVQRVLIHQSLYEEVKQRLVERARTLKMGDLKDEDTFIGPIISQSEAVRIEQWIEEAVAGGARVLCGGTRQDVWIPATVVEQVPTDCKLWREEVFGPVVALAPFDDFDQAIAVANDSKYGLQCGVFTDSRQHMFRAWDELEVGGVIVGDVPSWRVDNMPYGGVKNSGLGREGLRWAIEDMSELRLLVVRD